jgi:hypothetical protein
MARAAAIVFVALFIGFAGLGVAALVQSLLSPADAPGWFLIGLSMITISCLAIAFAVWKLRR